jgi:hypothetical protein
MHETIYLVIKPLEKSLFFNEVFGGTLRLNQHYYTLFNPTKKHQIQAKEIKYENVSKLIHNYAKLLRAILKIHI